MSQLVRAKRNNQVFNAVDFGGAVANCIKLTDGAMTSSSNTLTSATGSFTATDVGKNITVVGAAAGGQSLRTTITGYTSATQVTLNTGASTTVSNAVFFWGTDAKTAIQTTITAAIAVGGVAYIPPGSYYISGRMTGGSYTTLRGGGKGRTILYGGNASDWMIYHVATITGFVIEDITFDVATLYRASAVQLFYAQKCRVERCEFKNIPSSGWGLVIGVSDAGTDNTICEGNKIIDCDFDTKTGVLEMLLLFNCRNTEVVRPSFINNVSGPIFGLWQKTYATKIINPNFYNNAGQCIYYSITCEDTWIEDLYAENCSTVIQGANVSDFGDFGLDRAENVKILNPIIVGGSNSTTSTAIQIGAVNDALVYGGSIELYEVGIKINNGNTPASAAPLNWRIVDTLIKNCNPVNNLHTLHPAILVASTGVALYGQIKGCNIYDDQATKTQRYPIVFEGSETWTDLDILDNRLLADTANSGTSIRLNTGAVLGSNVIIARNKDYSGVNITSTSIQVINNSGYNPQGLYAQGNVTGATTFDRVNGDVITATATGNVTTTITNGKAIGDTLKLIITQDATGGRTISKPSNVKLVGGAFSPTATAAAVDSWTLAWDGTNWREISRALNVS